MKITNNARNWKRRTKIIVAGAVLAPVLVGSFAAANAVGGSGAGPTQTGTGQASLTDEGRKLARESGLPSSGSISVGASATAGDGFKPSDVHVLTGVPSGSQFSGSAALTEEGQQMVKDSGKTSGSLSAGPDGVIH